MDETINATLDFEGSKLQKQVIIGSAIGGFVFGVYLYFAGRHVMRQTFGNITVTRRG